MADQSRQATFDSSGADSREGAVQQAKEIQEDGGESPSGTVNTSRRAGSPGASNVSRHLSEELESWCAERREQGENFGYGHLFAETRSDLDGVQYGLGWETRIERSAPEDEATTHDKAGFGAVKSSDGLETIVSWKLGLLSTPYHPQLRDVPVDNLRVFVADAAREYLREEGYPVKAVLGKLGNLPEHYPTEDDLAVRREGIRLRRKGGAQGILNHQETAIEQTVRSEFGFTSKYGSSVPDPDVRYADFDLVELKEHLEETREWLTASKERLSELREVRQETRSEWVNRAREQHFPGLAENGSNGGSENDSS